MEVAGYTSRQAAVLFGLAPARVRAMARAGILSPSRGPRREYRFSFQDLVLLRTATALLGTSLPRHRVHRALRNLVSQLPEGRRPSEVHLGTDGTRILAKDGDLVWNPETGQTSFDFVTAATTPVEALAPSPDEAAIAEDWYQHGLDLEPFDPDSARAAYGQALEMAPDHAGAHVNLGHLLQSAGAVAEAIGHYRAALEASPSHATAAFNLGTALEELGHTEEAIAAYRLALTANPALHDAHYNLSLLYQKTGHKLAAMVHLKRSRELIGRN